MRMGDFNCEYDDALDSVEEQELFEHFHFDVDKGQAMIRIDKFLTSKIQNVSRNRIQAATDAGNILVNGKAVKSSYKVKPLDSISIVMAYPPRDTTILPEDLPINIIYEDEQAHRSQQGCRHGSTPRAWQLFGNAGQRTDVPPKGRSAVQQR